MRKYCRFWRDERWWIAFLSWWMLAGWGNSNITARPRLHIPVPVPVSIRVIPQPGSTILKPSRTSERFLSLEVVILIGLHTLNLIVFETCHHSFRCYSRLTDSWTISFGTLLNWFGDRELGWKEPSLMLKKRLCSFMVAILDGSVKSLSEHVPGFYRNMFRVVMTGSSMKFGIRA